MAWSAVRARAARLRAGDEATLVEAAQEEARRPAGEADLASQLGDRQPGTGVEQGGGGRPGELPAAGQNDRGQQRDVEGDVPDVRERQEGNRHAAERLHPGPRVDDGTEHAVMEHEIDGVPLAESLARVCQSGAVVNDVDAVTVRTLRWPRA
ncbi:MAG: hypothetical protein ACYCTH_11640 [Cellulomonas sp.]